MSKTAKLSVSRSYGTREVSVRFDAAVRGYGASLRVQGSDDITCAEAREFAAALIAQADAADAKADKKDAAEARRKAWLDREVAAGRMKVFGLKDFAR